MNDLIQLFDQYFQIKAENTGKEMRALLSIIVNNILPDNDAIGLSVFAVLAMKACTHYITALMYDEEEDVHETVKQKEKALDDWYNLYKEYLKAYKKEKDPKKKEDALKGIATSAFSLGIYFIEKTYLALKELEKEKKI